jgi:hypothetical protein
MTTTATDGPVMRVTMFRPADMWHELDRRLRELLPVFAGQSGLLEAWVGRGGTGSSDERLVVSIWASARAQETALTVPDFLELESRTDSAIVDRRTEVFAVQIRERFTRERPMQILRIFRGQTRPGEMDAYLAEARQGVVVDGRRPQGPGAVVCAVDGQDGFVTASLWADWPAIEAATGGDVHHPLATRNAARLVGGAPAHFELIAATQGAADGIRAGDRP